MQRLVETDKKGFLAEALVYGGSGQNRTADTRIFSPMLYRLSYRPTAIKMMASSIRISPCLSRYFLAETVEPAAVGSFFYPAHDESAGDFVVPALLSFVNENPEKAQI